MGIQANNIVIGKMNEIKPNKKEQTKEKPALTIFEKLRDIPKKSPELIRVESKSSQKLKPNIERRKKLSEPKPKPVSAYIIDMTRPIE